MEVIVKYSDYNEVIEKVELPINADQRQFLKVTKIDDGTGTMVNAVTLETVDDTISFTVSHTMNKYELRDYMQLIQKLLAQMNS